MEQGAQALQIDVLHLRCGIDASEIDFRVVRNETRDFDEKGELLVGVTAIGGENIDVEGLRAPVEVREHEAGNRLLWADLARHGVLEQVGLEIPPAVLGQTLAMNIGHFQR